MAADTCRPCRSGDIVTGWRTSRDASYRRPAINSTTGAPPGARGLHEHHRGSAPKSMPNTETDILLRFPPRLLTPGERELVGEWLSLAPDISSAYVSSRPSDDPAMYHRVVISDAP